ncbi:galactofuranose ABC transporter, permease protein YjfF [Serratia fonticola]|uniref:galactofuranose ABC transporter, permease protein YjfF n=1 Tax=Serratia fonticola TaxID=47917 RepID=UPI001586BF3C|nr:galactofuranose ABC transporter, permease protein YjfF [Serratia fonticola]
MILSGGIDLSVGSVIAFTGVLLAKLIGTYGIAPGYAFVIALLMGASFGALMGWIIDVLKLPAFIITLAGMFFVRGMSFIVSEESLPIDHPLYATLANYAWKVPGGGRFTLLALVMLLVVAIGMILAHRTRFGHNVYAIGGNPVSAGLMGVPVRRTTIQIYMLSSTLAAPLWHNFLAIHFRRLRSSCQRCRTGCIAAVVIGGTLLTGGVGTILGTLFGVLIQGLIQSYITFDGSLSSWWTKIVIGILLFCFIGLQKAMSAFWQTRRAKPRHPRLKPS